MNNQERQSLIDEANYNLQHCFCTEKTKQLMQIVLTHLSCEAQPAPVSVPDGWRLVPEVPDGQMITAWKDANYNNASLESAFRNMLNAAPEPPQAMQMSDEAHSRKLFEKWCSVNIERNKWHAEFYAHLPAREQWAAWEACHASMLQELQKSAGDSNNCRGSENMQVVQVVQVVQEKVRCGTKAAPTLDSSPKKAESRCGNSAVIPDGYVMVPKEPTKEMIDAGWLHFMGTKNPSSKGTYKAMLAAAPQEVKGE